MCGIAGIHLKPSCALGPETLERLADALLLGIDERGGHATGYVARSKSGETRLQRASCDARLFIDERRPFPVDTQTVLLHTRFATQGDPAFPENNHPVYAGTFYCVHNGHVSNDRALIDAAGVLRLGRVDSEAIPVTVREHGWERAGGAMAALEGPAAVALLDSATGRLILARGYANPLVVLDSPSITVWASTMNAIHKAWTETLGTPPAASRYEWLTEGDLLRFSPSGERSSERFSSYRPVITYYRYLPTQKTKSLTDGRGHWLGWDEPDTEKIDEQEDRQAECANCGEWFAVDELWEIYPGFPICWECEDQYLYDRDEAPKVAAPVLAEAPKGGKRRSKRTRRA